MSATTDTGTEPIALVGIGCRFPGGANGPAALWTLLEDGVDAIRPVPADRWNVDRHHAKSWQQPGRMIAREGGFLDRVDTFDAAFFGISGRVAEQMDPQQRLLLEVCWEALEDAGIVPATLAGSRTSVFVGACSQDYGGLQTSVDEVEGLGTHSATGMYASILSNRLSYAFDLRGPSMTVDTACSSSLVAVDLARRSLALGGSEIALVGGVNVMLTPQGGIALSQASMLSPDSRSRAFDKSANGYVRGEGAGVVVLKPLSAARRDNDRVYAVITGSAVNQDGRTPGITVPNGKAQQDNFLTALVEAAVAPRDVGYVEAHGTGTPVGDPIEANALGRVLVTGRDAGRIAFVGSIKTNIGHLEGGAGIAGLIKAALSVHHRRIPPTVHFRTPNPDIDFERWRMAVPTAGQPWPPCYARAVASVNSFGFGGTNANVVLEEVPQPRHVLRGSHNGVPALLVLSADSEAALDLLAQAHLRRLVTGPVDLDRLGATLALRRTHHPHRLTVVAATAAEAVNSLRDHLDGAPVKGVAAGRTTRSGGKVAFLFNGQGPQWFAMGRTLLDTSTVFHDKVQECDALARRFIDWSIIEALTADESSSPVDRTSFLQPMMFTIQVALAELWKSWGVEPDGVLGHSMGEIAAAHVSGALDLASALTVICRRAHVQDKADPSGGMAFVALGADQARALCDERPGGPWFAAENGPGGSTLSGRRAVLDELVRDLRAKGVFAKVLRVGCACHSQDMDPLRDELLAELDGVTGSETEVPMYSTVTGARVDGAELGTPYWWRNFREPVLFAPAVRAMLADGFDTFVELSPHPVLSGSIDELVAESGAAATVVASLAHDADDWREFLGAVGALHVAGTPVAWKARYPDGADVLDLPSNPWRHERFWNESEVARRKRTAVQTHPMMIRVDAPRPTWETKWDDQRLTWVKAHEVFGSVLVPGAAYVEMALAAAGELTGEPCALRYVEFERPCVLQPDEPQVSRIELDPDDGTFECHSRPLRRDTWIRTARGRYHRARAPKDDAREIDLDALKARCPAVLDAVDVYGTLQRKGYAYGPALSGIQRLHLGDGEALARIVVPRVLSSGHDGYLLHPALLDACFQTAIVQPSAQRPDELLPTPCLLTGFDSVRRHLGGVPAWSHTRTRTLDSSGLSADVRLLDERGRVLAEFTGLRGKAVPRPVEDQLDDDLYRLVWQADRRWTPNARTSAFRAAPSAVEPELRAAASTLAARLRRRPYTTDCQMAVREVCAAYIADCLRSLGCSLVPGEHFSVSALVDVLPSYERAFLGLLRFLVEDGVLTEVNGAFHVETTFDADPEELWAETLLRHPAALAELLLLHKTGAALREVLTGRIDPLALLFPEGSQEGVDTVYQTSPSTRFHNGLVKHAVEHLVRAADPRRTIRVLEVGGGTAGLTTHVLPVLPPERTEYVFTDVSEAFLRRAQDRFGSHPGFRRRLLDLNADLSAQGITTGSYDLVLASDVLHATEDLDATLRRLRAVLAPGGVLAVIEAEPGSRWLELTFGLTSGWWRARDTVLRPHGPLLAPSAWKEALRSAGYDDVIAVGDPGHQGPGAQTALLARAPAVATEPRPAVGPEQVGDWVIVGESAGVGAELALRIEARGGRAIRLATGERAGLAAQYERVFPSTRLEGVVHLVDAGADRDVDDGVALQARVLDSCLRITDLLRAVDRSGAKTYLVTRGAHVLRDDSARLDQAPAWGMGLTARLELPQLRCTMIDLDPVADQREADVLWAELWRGDHECEIAFRAGERFVRRLHAVARHEVDTPVSVRHLTDEQCFTLVTTGPGSLEDLRYEVRPRRAPAPGQVEIEVVAAGMNFLDVMTALGQVPPLESSNGVLLGAECAGIITRVGDGVDHALRPGDAVVAVVPEQGTVASHVTTDAVHVVAKPEQIGFEEAASIPVVFLTAWHALREIARLAPGERVLVHSAAGGTGLAAVRIAALTGAEVIATAGSPQKREFLRSLGIEHVLDSRSPAFADHVRAATGGAGVDVVLSATTGETFRLSIGCLSPHGRFVEIGKRNALGDHKAGLRPFLHGLTYATFDLRQMLRDRPQAMRAELQELLALFADGTLRPLPHRVYHPSQAQAALRRLSSVGHIGKVVLAMDERDVHAALPAGHHADGTWLITGGLGGVGLAMARALADTGVRHVVLVGRSGAASEGARAVVESLRARGVQVVTESVDVASRPEVVDLLARTGRDLPPLRGVLHCAMVLRDGPLVGLDEPSLDSVIAPKLLGAWHLHELTAELPLDAFVLFSSAASMTGNRGQANYAAANTFLDHLAHVRHARGLPALAVNWGVFSDVGYVAHNDDVARKVAATGMNGMSAAQAFRVLTERLLGRDPQIGVLPMDWPRFFLHHDLDRSAQPRYEHLATIGGSGDGEPSTPVARHEAVATRLRARVAAVLGMPADALDETTPLMGYLDSLLAVEISSWIERELGAKVTIMELMNGPSIAQLAEQLTAAGGPR